MRMFCALMTVFISLSAHAQPRYDGNWWRDQLDDSLRLGYVVGHLQGVEFAGLLIPEAICTALDMPPKRCNDVGWLAYRQAFGTYTKPTSGQFLEGLNGFYQDYRNRQIVVPVAMNYVGRTIGGTPAAELERMVERMRKSAAASK